MVVSGEYVKIGSTIWNKDDTITLSAKEYNTEKKIGWKLPRDINTTYSEVTKRLEITPVGLPKDMTYQVRMLGYKDLTPSNIKWYLRTLNPDGGGCDINTWNPATWKNISTTVTSSNIGDNGSAIYKLKI